MNIVFLDHHVIDKGDIDWSKMKELGYLTLYPDCLSDEDAIVRLEAAGAEAVLVDEFPITRKIMQAVPDLKFIGTAATGYNHIDLDCAREMGIAVYNVPAYSTEAVAQHTFALLLMLAGRIREFDRDVHEGLWTKEAGYGYEPRDILLLEGRSLGIIGYGNIGKRVAEIAQAFGMTVNIFSKDPQAAVSSDVVTLHCPLTPENRGMVGEAFLGQMKDGAILINTARGGLLDEAAVAYALKTGKLSGVGVDVMSSEPPDADNPLLHARNCIITPHIAFTPQQIRQRVIDICAENLRGFIEGVNVNRIA